MLDFGVRIQASDDFEDDPRMTLVPGVGCGAYGDLRVQGVGNARVISQAGRDFFVGNLLVRIRLTVEMIL